VHQLRERGLLPELDATAVSAGKVGDWGTSEKVEWDHAGRTKSELRQDYWYIKRAWDFHSQWMGGDWGPCHQLEDGDTIETVGAMLRVVVTPGHAEDHASLLLEEDLSLFSGDTVLGFGTTFQQDLFDYMGSLHTMLALQPSRLFPGHGPAIDDSVDFLSRYIDHRQVREDQVQATLAEACRLDGKAAVSAKGLASVLYTDTAKDKLWMAVENCEKVLRKLEKDGVAFAWIRGAPKYKRYVFPLGFVRRFPDELVWSTALVTPTSTRY
jgi:glyoxylase-like metal-dependent hydrolase (beta-lactamase superfamily II)